MSKKTEILTPVGRLVAGSLYEAQTTDAEGKPLTIRHGVNAGQSRVEYFFAVAVEKHSETHWNQTEWGAKIWKVGQDGFPGGQATRPDFAWKVQDGDSAIPNRAGRRNCDREGYPGHWVLHFSSGFAPQIVKDGGTKQLVETNFINLGDYIEVYGNIQDNGAVQQPGVFLNHQIVGFAGYGDRIILGVDPKSVGFGKSPLPAGVRATPPADARFTPAGVAAPVAVPPPYPDILQPGAQGGRVMLPKAAGATYEQMAAMNWTDEQLIQHGYMQA